MAHAKPVKNTSPLIDAATAKSSSSSCRAAISHPRVPDIEGFQLNRSSANHKDCAATSNFNLALQPLFASPRMIPIASSGGALTSRLDSSSLKVFLFPELFHDARHEEDVEKLSFSTNECIGSDEKNLARTKSLGLSMHASRRSLIPLSTFRSDGSSHAHSGQGVPLPREGDEMMIHGNFWTQYTPPESLLFNETEAGQRLAVPAATQKSGCGDNARRVESLRADSGYRSELVSSRPNWMPPDVVQQRKYNPNVYGSGEQNPLFHHREGDNNGPTSSILTGVERPCTSEDICGIRDMSHSLSSPKMYACGASCACRTNGNSVKEDASSCVSHQSSSIFARFHSSVSNPPNTLVSSGNRSIGSRSPAGGADHSAQPWRFAFQRGRAIGSGGFGTVFQAILCDGTLAAVKEIKLENGNLKLIDREVRTMSSLPPHPNCVRYFGSRHSRNHYYIIMEYISGGSIYSLRQSVGRFRESVFQRYAYMVLLGLQHLHANQIIHRDIKGANVLLDERGCAKIVDFGCCKDLNNAHCSASGGGTPLWMAPEVCRGEAANEKSDVWSFGCLCLEMTNDTGLPWKFPPGMTLQGLTYSLACAQNPPPIPTTLSSTAQDFIYCCLRLNPEERWSVDALLNHRFFEINYDLLQDEEEEDMVVSCNTSSQQSALKRLIERVNQNKLQDILSHGECEVVPSSPRPLQSFIDNPAGTLSAFTAPSETADPAKLTYTPVPLPPLIDSGVDDTFHQTNIERKSNKSRCTPTAHLQTVNAGFRLDAVDENDIGDNRSHAVSLKISGELTQRLSKDFSTPNTGNDYYATLDDLIALAQRAREEEQATAEKYHRVTLYSSSSTSETSQMDKVNMRRSADRFHSVWTVSDEDDEGLCSAFTSFNDSCSRAFGKTKTPDSRQKNAASFVTLQKEAEKTATGVVLRPGCVLSSTDPMISLGQHECRNKKDIRRGSSPSVPHKTPIADKDDPGTAVILGDNHPHTKKDTHQLAKAIFTSSQRPISPLLLSPEGCGGSKGSATPRQLQQPRASSRSSSTKKATTAQLVWNSGGHGSISKDFCSAMREVRTIVSHATASSAHSIAHNEVRCNAAQSKIMTNTQAAPTEKPKPGFSWIRKIWPGKKSEAKLSHIART